MQEIKQFVVQKRVSGVIIPPPEIKAIAIKTADFVSRKGQEFEDKILKSKDSIQFNFLKQDDPYHAFYLEKIEEFKKKYSESYEQEIVEEVQSQAPQIIEEEKTNVVSAQPSKLTPMVYLMRNIPDGPPPDRQFDIVHPNISLYDMDLIKLTAQYAAINGKKFLVGLEQRESQNPIFDFIKSTHILFSYFSNLVQSYHKIINLQRDIPKRLESNKDPMKILSTCIHRIEFRKIEEDQQRDIDREYERQQFNAIDWNDFQIVETIDIPELELENSNPQKKTVAPPVVVPAPIPIPVAIPVIAPMHQFVQPFIAQPIYQPIQPIVQPPANIQPQSRFNQPQKLNIKANYVPQPTVPTYSVKSFIDPISHRAIPLNQSQQHMNIELLDPNGIKQQERFKAKLEGTNLQSTYIGENLKNMAAKRPDIFGDVQSTDVKKQKPNIDPNYNEHGYQMKTGTGVSAERKGPIVGPQQ